MKGLCDKSGLVGHGGRERKELKPMCCSIRRTPDVFTGVVGTIRDHGSQLKAKWLGRQPPPVCSARTTTASILECASQKKQKDQRYSGNWK